MTVECGHGHGGVEGGWFIEVKLSEFVGGCFEVATITYILGALMGFPPVVDQPEDPESNYTNGYYRYANSFHYYSSTNYLDIE